MRCGRPSHSRGLRVASRFSTWTRTSEAAETRVRDGADSFLIENGWIVAQTIHYTVEPK